MIKSSGIMCNIDMFSDIFSPTLTIRVTERK
ncbi:hypothetical protein NTE_00581 [Candidatus Nitrososphaera evergladensis SR1]|uniref:Uncharacterized protein n=1 Tax=Candidatus Nitrososphaera evergladensis SR1 TaxID=1459636 RepID=A0A075MPE2_9ARCH|nr:hypothetical protein NTE_00581 [Candidatus Nitrososphaera evergladensis SR1]